MPVTEMDSLMRADIVIGADIRTPEDEELGEIENVVLDPARQMIAYVLASRGGFLGLGEELVAVRWSDLRATTDHEIYVLDASPDVFAAAPKVERGELRQVLGRWRAQHPGSVLGGCRRETVRHSGRPGTCAYK